MPVVLRRDLSALQWTVESPGLPGCPPAPARTGVEEGRGPSPNDALTTALARAAESGADLLLVEGDLPGNSPGALPAGGEPAPVAVWYWPRQAAGGWMTRPVDWTARGIERLLLRTGKQDDCPGAVLLTGEAARRVSVADFPVKTAAQIVAAARCVGLPVVETRCTHAVADLPAPALRDILGRIARSLRFWWRSIAFPGGAGAVPASRRPGWAATALLMMVAGAVLFLNLGYPLFEPDETRNAELALNALQTGEWLALSLDGEPYWDKPPLLTWMTASSYRLFGISEWSTRLPGALCSLLTVAALAGLGGRLMGGQAGWWGAALLLVSVGFTLMGRFVTMDAPLAFFATVMMLAALLGTRGQVPGRGWLALAGVACGLGLLAKGPVILVLVLPPLLAGLWLEGRPFARQRAFWLWPGVPAFLIAAPWYLATAMVNPSFLSHFFWKHNLMRFSEAFNHRQPFWFYLPVILLAMYPASFLLGPFLRLLWSGRESRRLLGPNDAAVLLGASWTIGFFSLSDSKLPTYVLPAIPLLALLLGRMVDLGLSCSAADARRLWLRSTPWHLALSAAVMTAVAAAVLLVDAVREQERKWPAIAVGALAGGLGLAVRAIGTARARPAAAWSVALGAAAMFTVAILHAVIPELSRDRSLHAVVARKTAEPGFADWPVLYFGERAHASELTMPDENVRWIALDDVEAACGFLEQHPQTILVTHPFNVLTLQRHLGFAVRFRAEDGQRKLFLTESVSPVWTAAEESLRGPRR